MSLSRAGELESNTDVHTHKHVFCELRLDARMSLYIMCARVCVCVCYHARLAAKCVILGHCVFCQDCD